MKRLIFVKLSDLLELVMIKAVLLDLGGVYFEDGTIKFLNLLAHKTGKSLEELYPIFREGKSLDYRKNKLSGAEFYSWAASQLGGGITATNLMDMWHSQYTEDKGGESRC